MYEYYANYAYTSLKSAQSFLSIEGITGIELKTIDVEHAPAIAERLQAQVSKNIDVLDWQELNRSLFYALKLEKIAMFVVLTFIILVASFSIVAMLIMIVIEKGREIAILKALGATNQGIMGTFIFQGMVIGTVGAFLGLISGLGICWFLAEFGFPLNSEVYYISTLPVDVDTSEITVVVLATLVISFLATIYPSIQAARLNPVQGLRDD
jgi:lipoprotein-releasing system permease protein